MKRPTPPIKPIKPGKKDTPPNKYIKEYFYFNSKNFSLKKTDQFGTGAFYHDEFITFKQIKEISKQLNSEDFHIELVYDDCNNNATFLISVLRLNPNYEKELKIFENRFQQYENDMLTYEKEIIKYKERVKEHKKYKLKLEIKKLQKLVDEK